MSGICPFHGLDKTYSESRMEKRRKPFRLSRLVVWLGYVLIGRVGHSRYDFGSADRRIWAAADRLAMYLEKKGDV